MSVTININFHRNEIQQRHNKRHIFQFDKKRKNIFPYKASTTCYQQKLVKVSLML